MRAPSPSEERALRGEWGGEESPPLEELERHRRIESEWHRATSGPEAFPDPAVPSQPEEPAVPVGRPPEWWTDADEAVAAAGASLPESDRRMAGARRAVHTAEIADEADPDVHARSAAPVTSAPDAVEALARAGVEQREALADLIGSTAGGGLADRPMIALTDALTGALIALTDAGGLRYAGTCGRPARRGGVVPAPTT